MRRYQGGQKVECSQPSLAVDSLTCHAASQVYISLPRRPPILTEIWLTDVLGLLSDRGVQARRAKALSDQPLQALADEAVAPGDYMRTHSRLDGRTWKVVRPDSRTPEIPDEFPGVSRRSACAR